jgi:hypothetical protein
MKCSAYNSKLPFLPKGELPYEEQLAIKKHIESCAHCLKDYQEYLRMFYLIDKQVESTIATDILKDFSADVMEKIDNTNQNKYKHIIWYAAAAIIIFMLVLYPTKKEKNLNDSNNVSVTELIENEDWKTVLQKFSNNDVQEEQVSIPFLISKISKIDANLANNKLKVNFGANTKDIDNIINMLSEYHRFSKGISTIEILNFLKNNKGASS